jgi:hypothetical protein
MSRPQKQSVEYFPHFCVSGKTIFILKTRHGNNGYAFWFQLLEELGSSNGHYLDLNSEEYCEFLSAKTLVSVTEMMSVLDLLSRLDAIDQRLWQKKIVWSQNFVDNLAQVYAKRVVSAPEKPVSVTETLVSGDGNPQSKVKESKVNIYDDKSSSGEITIKSMPITLEELNDGEVTYESFEAKTPKKYKGKSKSYARIAITYLQLRNEGGNVLRYYPDIKELWELAEKTIKPDNIEKEIIARIKVFKLYQESKNLQWGLAGIIKHWNRIMTEYYQEVKDQL